MLPPIYWINLDRSTARQARMQAALDSRRLLATRLSAVDGLDNERLAALVRADGIEPRVAATIVSHLLALGRLHADGCAEAIVMEDDTSFELFDEWPQGFWHARQALPKNYGALQLCVGEEPHRLHRLYRQRAEVVRFSEPGYWSTGAYLISRDAARHVFEACRGLAGTAFDLQRHRAPLVADSLLFRLVATMPGVDGPWIARVPVFLFGADDSDVHPDHLNHQQRAQRFVRAVHPALRSGRYGRFDLLAYRWREFLRRDGRRAVDSSGSLQ